MALVVSEDGAVVSNGVTVEGAPAVRITGNGVEFNNLAGGLVKSTAAGSAALALEGIGGKIVNAAGGEIRAFAFNLTAILGSVNADSVVNSGTIFGNVRLGDGNDFYSERSASTGTIVDLGAGDDVYEQVSAGLAHPVQGGEGIDTLILTNGSDVLSGSMTSGFETLEVHGTPSVSFNLVGFSDYSAISLGNNGFYNFIASVNAGTGLSVAGGGTIAIRNGSSFASLTGDDGFNSFEVSDSTISGNISLAGGDDYFWYGDLAATRGASVIGGTVDGGSGLDTLALAVEGGVTVDLAAFSNFEKLDGGSATSVSSDVRVLHATGFQTIAADAFGKLVLAETNAPDTVLAPIGTAILEATVTLKAIGDPAAQQQQNENVPNPAASTSITNNGSILGSVYLLGGNDSYDGRLGSVGGSIYGWAGNDTLIGGADQDEIFGGSGDDVLDGGGGPDIMTGGTGNDAYVVDTLGDVVVELPGEGTDEIRTNLSSYTLNTSNVENLSYVGTGAFTGTGDANDNVITGGAMSDSLFGGGGNDTLVGGLGNDTMTGGAGNDIYVSDHNGDLIVEAANGGIDEVRTSNQTYDIYNYAHVENLTGTSSLGQILSGNDLNNVITGAGGADLINGGYGNDTMVGGLGNDTYVVEQAGDLVVEKAGEGTDRTDTTLASYTLTDNVEILVGRLTTGQTLIGNGLNNLIQARDGNDVLDGGVGNDNMQGGLGNDTYYVDAAGDSILENAASGTDSVFASVSYTLSANVENLTLTGAGNLNGTGNDLANIITGTSGNNLLDGGAGADQMAGGLGDDTYVVDHAGDKTIEAVGGGNDIVLASVSYVLGANVERLTLTGTGNITGVGNALNNVIVGNSGNNTLSGGAGADTMTGGLGNDTYIVDDAGDTIVELSGQGVDTVQVGFTYTLTSTFENLTLTGVDAIDGTGNGADNVIVGNSASNLLTGNGGNDTLDGGAGPDTMIGGFGNDIYVVDDGGDQVSEAAGAGTDTVRSSISYALEDNFEVLTLTGSADIDGTGNALANSLNGNSGNNRLDGGAGADLMAGGLGDDDYFVWDLGDRVTETSAAGGYDTVWSAVSFYMTSNVEKIVLTGLGATTAVGNELDNVMFGNTANNSLYGGLGNDRMEGGLGNDIYYVEQAGDFVTEFANSGTDTVVTTLSYTLGNFLENLTLTGSAALSGTGNDLNNVITGNSGANTLSGGIGNDTLIGGIGNDTLVGGVGNDTYVIDGGDTLVEAAGEGTDTVQSAISYTLLDNFEVLTLTGTANLNGTGNAADNSLNGNSGNNILDGGAGADGMFGGLGNDTYIVDNVADKAVETSAVGGTDEVKSSVTFVLGGNVENLTLTGSAAVNGFGNTLDNFITGNSANNSLAGGAGADTLDGKGGIDSFLYTNTSDSTSAAMDHILGFTAGEKIDLSGIDASTTATGNNAFAFIGAGAFTGSAGELRAYQSGSEWFVEADTDGDGLANLVISVASGHALAAGDFVV